jgi:hypothetical protein
MKKKTTPLAWTTQQHRHLPLQRKWRKTFLFALYFHLLYKDFY